MTKNVVITGAGVGLGRTLARRFAADGDNVVLLGRTFSKVEAVANEIGERATAIECDISDPDSIASAFEVIAKQHVSIDALINNAAIFEPYELVKGSQSQILSAINTNFTGTILCSRAAIPMMENGAHIINISSESVELPLAHLTIYQATKAGIEGFSKMLNLELQEAGIRVTVVRCGQMYEEGKTWDVDVDAQRAFHGACLERGIELHKRPISQFGSLESIFRMLVDLPPDIQVGMVHAEARGAR